MLSGIRAGARRCARPSCAKALLVRQQCTVSASPRLLARRSLTCSAEPDAAAATATPEQAAEPLPTYAVDLRVGKIVSCEKHPDADSLYVEKIDVGEDEPRTIISGLVNFVSLEDMLDRRVVIIANLKARNMRGIKSHGMVLCASDEAHENVEPLMPPEGAEIGERIFFEEGQPKPETENRVQKKKLWEQIQPELKTTSDLVAVYKDVPMMTSVGPVKSPSLAAANIS
eukprot:TRINITY_DN3892_c1_g2_i1.p1 TRINITY_DN3892_c1_g2~~TRINITY_DN3892_c1_g2_i1.p1  ORF type:complete len:228 (-),score=21.85 TRINITY_DN3892_c1_g2_i1:270-953(-)